MRINTEDLPFGLRLDNGNTHCVLWDTYTDRQYGEWWKCQECDEWVVDEDVVWSDEKGNRSAPNSRRGPYCDGCVPNEEEWCRTCGEFMGTGAIDGDCDKCKEDER